MTFLLGCLTVPVNEEGGASCQININSAIRQNFEAMSKRRRGYPSETSVKRGLRIVHCDKELTEKLGRNDLCPCGSRRKFKNCCLKTARFDGSQRHHYF